jgi:tetratricopeptide (TPR) repeat protein
MKRTVVLFCIIILLIIGCQKKVSNEFKQARYLHSDKNFEEALVWYNKAIEADSNLCEAYSGVIRCQFQLEKGDSITDFYYGKCVSDTNNPAVLFAYGYALYRKGELDSALIILEKVKNQKLSDGYIDFTISMIHEYKEDTIKTIDYLRTAVERHCGYACFGLVDYLHDDNEKVSMMIKGIDYLVDKGWGYNNLGDFFMEQGNEKEAIKWWKKTSEFGYKNNIQQYKDRHIVMPTRFVAGELSKQGLYNAAIDKYKEAIEIKENAYYIHAELAWALYRNGEYVEALRECKRTLELCPNSPNALNIMAAIYIDQKDFALAEAIYKKLLTIDHLNFGYSNFAILYLDQGKSWKAMALIEKGLKINPGGHLYYIKGKILVNRGEYNDALDAYSKAEEYGMSDDYLTSVLYYEIARALYLRDLVKKRLPSQTKKLCLSYLQKSIEANLEFKHAKELFDTISKIKTK